MMEKTKKIYMSFTSCNWNDEIVDDLKDSR